MEYSNRACTFSLGGEEEKEKKAQLFLFFFFSDEMMATHVRGSQKIIFEG